MDSLLYMGVRITPASLPSDVTPGAWLPRATLLEVASGKALGAVTEDQGCDTRQEADARALRLGKRHVMKVLHQG
ncbi:MULTISPECIES: hypothetical protein [Delftia]|jgi:hypothetical protein|uniref:Uncharacterized protein n=1 Tax=Delftia tsuruhatensis TaxID=180282 RepID=A0AAX3SQN3_9BURK|nr:MULTISPECIES: hypothetical protein [Delftia]AOV02804.1 hypothetical protein BI380_16375 [Delftia tsuruhatensis]MDC2858120.1 hypothetical protein [Delftia sp. DT-2]MDH0420243.1 hypothetical protein [Delftia tsuruhatensis]MDH0775983.1 hypothetical protein [Delftia tsuruhatensis]MDH0852057.1 hypothetical protein [Delftia tsuruhatensis]